MEILYSGPLIPDHTMTCLLLGNTLLPLFLNIFLHNAYVSGPLAKDHPSFDPFSAEGFEVLELFLLRIIRQQPGLDIVHHFKDYLHIRKHEVLGFKLEHIRMVRPSWKCVGSRFAVDVV